MNDDLDPIRPGVSLDLDENEFERRYWPVAEQQEFCHRQSVSLYGRKAELRERVAAALSGEKSPVRKQRLKPSAPSFDWA